MNGLDCRGCGYSGKQCEVARSTGYIACCPECRHYLIEGPLNR